MSVFNPAQNLFSAVLAIGVSAVLYAAAIIPASPGLVA